MNQSSILLFDGARGVYIPQNFAEEIKLDKFTGIKQEDLEILSAGPDHEWYWEAWDTVLNNAIHIDESGNEWILYQDQDVWLLCPALMDEEEQSNFFEI